MKIRIRVNNPEPKMANEGTIDVSKNSLGKDLKQEISNLLNKIPISRLRVMGAGKEVSDENKIFEYKFPDDVLLQVIIRPPQLAESNSGAPSPKKPRLESPEERPAPKPSTSKSEDSENAEPVESEYFDVGDMVDAVDDSYDNGLFPGRIVNIVRLSEADKATKTLFECDGLDYWVKLDGVMEEEEPVSARLGAIRPRPVKRLEASDLTAGQRVMVNYNVEEPSKLGFWFDAIVIKPPEPRRKTMTVTLIMGDSEKENCQVRLEHGVYESRSRVLKSERDPEEKFQDAGFYPKREFRPRCDECLDDPKAKCKECGCSVCHGKNDLKTILICDECQDSFHMACHDPPLEEIPENDWFCSKCQIDRNAVVGAGEKLKKSKKLEKSAAANCTSGRDWGRGNATASKQVERELRWIPKDHVGPIRGIEVGMTWTIRMQCSCYGVHRPPVGGIHARGSGEKPTCFSIVLAGGYEDDEDSGDFVSFTGSGGRNLKDGNKRTSAQDSHQTLTGGNLGLAVCCNGNKKPNEAGEKAKDWKKNPPIRVMRSYKGKKHSKYAPDAGVRYDGIYRLTEYKREMGQSGFYVYRFYLRRDDPSPAPWTKEGKKFIQDRGYNTPLELKAKPDEVWKKTFKLSKAEKALIEADAVNKQQWDEVVAMLPTVELEFLDAVSQAFLCSICQDTPVDPVNLPCNHLFCKKCVVGMLKKSGAHACAFCKQNLDKEYKPTVNSDLKKALETFLPGYSKR